jgi:aldose 1-epimerase
MDTQAPKPFGVLSDGREVTEYTLCNRNGIVVKVLNYGGIIRKLEAPDRTGQMADIVLGFDDLSRYEGEHPYFGAIIGRVAGRISGGRLDIEGQKHQLTVNDSPNHLHGGFTGFDRKLWDADYCADRQSLTLTRESAAGEEGYPGTLISRVRYQHTHNDDLIVQYHAAADAPTVVNMTQHSYFNLSGDASKTVLDHTLTVHSDRVLELGDRGIPTGRELDVADTAFDLRAPRVIGQAEGGGFDNYWVLAKEGDDSELKTAVELWHAESGRSLQIATTAPGVQIYTGNQIPEGLVGKQEVSYGPQCGICFETQVHPDSPNRPEFPTISLDANDTCLSTTVFGIRVARRVSTS